MKSMPRMRSQRTCLSESQVNTVNDAKNIRTDTEPQAEHCLVRTALNFEIKNLEESLT